MKPIEARWFICSSTVVITIAYCLFGTGLHPVPYRSLRYATDVYNLGTRLYNRYAELYEIIQHMTYLYFVGCVSKI